MNRKKTIVFWIIYHISVLVFSFAIAMLMKYNQTGNAVVPETYLVFTILAFMIEADGYLARFFIKRAAGLSQTQLRKQLIPGFLVFVAAVFIIANLSISAGNLVWYLVNDIDLHNYFPNLLQNELSYANKSLFMWMVFFSVVFFYILWRKTSIKEEKLREENLKYKYATLKSQVNPHFLFNSLNTLSELVYEDARKADEYIQKLSAIYRYVIENENNNLVDLSQELTFVLDYFSLLQLRDNNKIFLKITVENPGNYKIVPVSLQLLLENAVKHNIVSKSKPLKIAIEKQGDFLIVRNNLQLKNQLGSSTKVGLQNLKERTGLILNRELQVVEKADEFVVKVPILSEQ